MVRVLRSGRATRCDATTATGATPGQGGAQLNSSSLALGGANPADFAKSDTCGASGAAGASCTIRVTFSPTAVGARSAGVTIIDDAAGSPQTISGISITGPHRAARQDGTLK